MPKMPFSNKKVVQKSRDFIEQNAKICQKNEGQKWSILDLACHFYRLKQQVFPKKL
jgi:hypothetical protein